MFYTVPTARVIFMAKTSLDVFSLRQEQVWTFSVLGDQIYEMRCLFVAVGVGGWTMGFGPRVAWTCSLSCHLKPFKPLRTGRLGKMKLHFPA